jgi:hypothetical protein
MPKIVKPASDMDEFANHPAAQYGQTYLRYYLAQERASKLSAKLSQLIATSFISGERANEITVRDQQRLDSVNQQLGIALGIMESEDRPDDDLFERIKRRFDNNPEWKIKQANYGETSMRQVTITKLNQPDREDDAFDQAAWDAEFRAKTARIHDQLSRIMIYFIKEDHTHEMYNAHRDIDEMVAYVEPILTEIMEYLQIDPEARSY